MKGEDLYKQWHNMGLMCNVYCIAVTKKNIFAGTLDNGMYMATKNGTRWTKVNIDINPDVITTSGSNIFAGSAMCPDNGPGFYVSIDDGKNWKEIKNGPANGVRTLTLSSNNIFAGSVLSDDNDGGGVFLSTDNGSSWFSTKLTTEDVCCLCMNGSLLFTAIDTSIYLPNGKTGIYLSTDNGNCWTAVNTGLPVDKETIINNLVTKGNSIFASIFGFGVYVSLDYGQSWSPANTGLPLNVNALAVNGDNLYAGIMSNLYISVDNGQSWSPVYPKLPNYAGITSIAFDSNYVYLATDSGVFRHSF